MLRAATLALALLLPSAAAVQAATPSPAPREVVGRTAQAIEDEYFDAAKGKAIAEDLRREAADGKYDRLTDPRDLATTLSTRLRPLDHHFNVAYRPPEDSAGTTAPPGARPDRSAADRRTNYGFRKVEILPGGVGYIQMQFFADFQAEGDPAKAAADAALTLVAGSDAVIIDLRDNGGGSPAMVGYLVSAFTPKDAKIYNVFHSREGTFDETPPVWYASSRLDVPVYILVSGRTGSAAEALPYTLQAADRAVIVGETTGGAANPGGPVPLGDGFSVFISGGSPINPLTGGNWEETGVKPDVVVPADEALNKARELALETILARSPDGPMVKDSRWALEALKAVSKPVAYVQADYLGAYGPISIGEDNDRLVVRQGTRPAWGLVPLGDDTFFSETNPSRRVVFERDAAGRVIAFEIVMATGGGARFRRD